MALGAWRDRVAFELVVPMAPRARTACSMIRMSQHFMSEENMVRKTGNGRNTPMETWQGGSEHIRASAIASRMYPDERETHT